MIQRLEIHPPHAVHLFFRYILGRRGHVDNACIVDEDVELTEGLEAFFQSRNLVVGIRDVTDEDGGAVWWKVGGKGHGGFGADVPYHNTAPFMNELFDYAGAESGSATGDDGYFTF